MCMKTGTGTKTILSILITLLVRSDVYVKPTTTLVLIEHRLLGVAHPV
jgi:hypothetical protein